MLFGMYSVTSRSSANNCGAKAASDITAVIAHSESRFIIVLLLIDDELL